MINLLPSDEKRSIRAGFSNVLLVRYAILSGAALILIVGAMTAAFIVLDQSGKAADAAKQNNESKVAGFAEVNQKAAKLRKDLADVKKAFSDEVRYSKVLINLASILPNGTFISSFQADSQTLLSPMTLTVQVRDREAAEALQRSLNSSPYVASSEITSINTAQSQSIYAYSAEVNITFSRNIMV